MWRFASAIVRHASADDCTEEDIAFLLGYSGAPNLSRAMKNHGCKFLRKPRRVIEKDKPK